MEALLNNLKLALERAEYDRSCIAQNSGSDKELAREAYDDAIGELTDAITDALPELPGRTLETIARQIIKKLETE